MAPDTMSRRTGQMARNSTSKSRPPTWAYAHPSTSLGGSWKSPAASDLYALYRVFGFSRDPKVYVLNGSVDEVARLCLLYTSDAADDLLCVDLGGRRIINK